MAKKQEALVRRMTEISEEDARGTKEFRPREQKEATSGTDSK